MALASSASLVACFGSNGTQPGPDAGFALDSTTFDDGSEDAGADAPTPVDAPTETAADDAAPNDAAAHDASPNDAATNDAPAPAADASIDASIDASTDAGADAADGSSAALEASADAALTYPQVVLADHPLSYWRFGESSGTVAVDQTGTTNGTYSATGVTLGAPGAIAGDPDTAATFDGMSGYTDMGAAFAFGGTSPMTYEAWLKPNPADLAARRFMSKETSDANGREGFLMAYEASGTTADGAPTGDLLSFERWSAGTDSVLAVVTPDVYQHVVATYDGATMTIYVNGQPIGTTASTRSLETLADPFRVATYSDYSAAADCFGGTIDEVAIYDYALSAARVLVHYQVGSGM